MAMERYGREVARRELERRMDGRKTKSCGVRAVEAAAATALLAALTTVAVTLLVTFATLPSSA